MWRAVARRAAREALARSDAVAAREINTARAAASTLTCFRCVCGCASPAGAACERALCPMDTEGEECGGDEDGD